jgi:hypothetical protein
MSESITILRSRLAELRDASLAFYDSIWSFNSEGESQGRWTTYSRDWIWTRLTPELQQLGETLRAELRPLVVRISSALRNSPLMSEADFRDLTRHGKTMAAALRFCEHRQWNLVVQHDEGTVLGVDPPGQDELKSDSIEEARTLFTESYRVVTEMLDYWSPIDNGQIGAAGMAHQENTRSYRPNTAFLMTWISPDHPELNDLRDTVQEVFKAFGITATRADELEHEGIITERIMREIATSEFLFADLTGERPSVYYEVGFAHAIGKRVILFRKKGSKIHFDLAAHNCPEYENFGDLRKKLTKRVQAMTNKPDN